MPTPEKTQEGQKTHQDPELEDPKSDENILYSPWIAAERKSLSNADSVAGSAITALSTSIQVSKRTGGQRTSLTGNPNPTT
jgi:hypothetical protein